VDHVRRPPSDARRRRPCSTSSVASGFRCGFHKIGPEVGATRLGATIYDLPPGESICPYRYESREVQAGPDGAHRVSNRGAGDGETEVILEVLEAEVPHRGAPADDTGAP
jgi:hypothetical protein